MRQAGRDLPEYRAVREKAGAFLPRTVLGGYGVTDVANRDAVHP
jgi:hypothetical protein